jgi:hypothetical protein
MNNQIIDKRKHKLLIFTLKILPAIMADSYVIEMISIFLGFGTQVLVNFIGMIVAPILFMYLASYVFKFCEYHRIFIHYVLILEILTTIKWYYPVIVTSQLVLNVSFFLSGLLMLCVVFFNVYKIYKKYRRPSN